MADLQGLEANINLDVIQGGYITGSGNDGLTAWVSFYNYANGKKVADYTIKTGFEIRNIKKDNRNYVTFDVYGLNNVNIVCNGYGVANFTGDITLAVNESGKPGTDVLTNIWQTTKDLGDSYTFNQAINPVYFGTYTLAPQTSINIDNIYLLYWFNDVHKASLNDQFYFTLGKAIYNSNPATYIPDGIRKSNNWNALDPNGNIKIRKGGNWNSITPEQAATVHQTNTGFSRIRKNGTWIQQGHFN